MSVFLRWGIFGILGVAALLYAYNASKRMAERHMQQAQPAAQAAQNAAPAADEPPASAPELATPTPPVERAPPPPAHCETELAIAQRAIEARRSGEPLDRLLRSQEIAFESSPLRRARLERVALRYFDYEGEFQPEALRIAVISDCMQSSP
ncbi:MAG: hypothetical protein ABI821_18130 [Pseudomonadota bacterium]